MKPALFFGRLLCFVLIATSPLTLAALGFYYSKASAKDTRVEELAVKIQCPGFKLIASPADGKVTLDRVSALSECLGDKASQICTVQVVKLKDSQ